MKKKTPKSVKLTMTEKTVLAGHFITFDTMVSMAKTFKVDRSSLIRILNTGSGSAKNIARIRKHL